jgi:hypothetical protein
MAEWQKGRMVEWQKGGMAEWYFTTYLIYPAIFMVHADDDDDNDNDTDTFKSFIVQADRGFATDKVLFLSLFNLVT